MSAPRLASLLALGAGVLSSQCTLALQREPGQCESHADCQALGAEYLCSSDLVCVRFVASRDDGAAGDAGGCMRDDDCVDQGLAVCRRGACLPLNAPEHGCVSRDLGTTVTADGTAPLVIGMLAQRDPIYPASFERRLIGPVGTAINELNRARPAGASPALPALVGVACDETSPSAVEYLVDALRVNVLLGPTGSDRVLPILSQVGARSVLWAAFADGPNLQADSAAPASWLVSCKPNRASVRSYFLNAVAEAETWARAGVSSLSPVLAISGDVATMAFANGLNASSLADAGLRSVYYSAAARGRDLVRALEGMDPYPNLVVAASAEDDWGENIAALDVSSFDRTGAYPYYFLAEKRGELYARVINDQATAEGALPQYRRLMGLDYHRDAASRVAEADFEVAHRDETGAEPEPGFEYAYDCAYLSIYAAVAASQRFALPVWELPPDALASGVSALTGAGPLLSVGAASIADVLTSIVSNRGGPGSVNLIGASGALDIAADVAVGAGGRSYLAPPAPDGELYCVDAETKVLCDTGITFSALDAAPTRPDTPRCTCFGGTP